MILDERGIESFMDWGQRAKELLRQFGNPPSPRAEDQWQDWGMSLGRMPSFPVFPSPHTYKDWRSWVRDLNRVVDPKPYTPWSVIPNLAKNGAFSVNIFTTYFTLPSTGWTLTLNGSLPTGWSFASPTLSHAGAVLSGPNTISFKATFTANGLNYTSNTFTVQGI